MVLGTVEQQIALQRFDKRRHPKPHTGCAQQPFISQRACQCDIAGPLRIQAHIDHIEQHGIFWQIQSHQDLILDRLPACVNPLFELAQRTAGARVNDLPAGFGVSAAIEEGGAQALAHENGDVIG